MLEARLLYQKLQNSNKALEQTVQERTAELRESEARYRSLTELASDWYWEQDEDGRFSKESGPVLEMLGIRVDAFALAGGGTTPMPIDDDSGLGTLRVTIAARQPFIDYLLNRTGDDGVEHQYRVSGEPMFNESCRYVGYRGIGVEIIRKN